MSATIDNVSMLYFRVLFFMKLNMKAVAATTSMMTYCVMVTSGDAQYESASTGVKVRLHCNMFTAYFWKGKMAE